MLRGCIQFIFCVVCYITCLEAKEYAYVANTRSIVPAVSQIDLSTFQITKNFYLNNGELPHPDSDLRGMAITPDYKYLFVSNLGEGKGKIVSKIEISTGNITNIYNNDFQAPSSVAITPDGKFALVTNVKNFNIAIINVATNAVDLLENGGGSEFNHSTSIAITPDGKKAFIPTNDSGVFVINLTEPKQVNVINSPSLRGVGNIAISPNGLWAYLVNFYGNTISVIDVISEKWLYDIGGVDKPADIAISPSGKKAFVSSHTPSGTIYALDLTQGRKVKPQLIRLGSNAYTEILAFNAVGSKVFVCSKDIGKVFQINANTNAVEGFVTGFPGKINFITITPLPYTNSFQKASNKFTPIKFQR